jgi:hypothetical protein
MMAAAANLVAIDLISDKESLSFAVAGKMAEAILELRKTQGGCMPQDLNARGFKPSDVVENWDAAHFLIAINSFETWGKDNGKSKNQT